MKSLTDPIVSTEILGVVPAQPYVYFSYPLTGLAIDERKALHAVVSRLADFVRLSCKPYESYLPYENTDLVSRPEASQGPIRHIDQAMVAGACLVVAFLEPVSAEVAIELEWCVQRQIPVLACASVVALNREFGWPPISRLVLDTISATTHQFFEYARRLGEGNVMVESDEQKLKNAIEWFLAELNESR